MAEILNNSVIWFSIGLIFFLLEFIVPGFILFFFGLGAWIVSLVVFLTDVSINAQLLIFMLSSSGSVLLFRNYLKNKLGLYKVNNQSLEDEFIGKIALAETAISPGLNGKVDFKGTTWEASSDDTIMPGENVTIIATRSILLIVKSTKSI